MPATGQDGQAEPHEYVEPEEFGDVRALELYHYYRPPTTKKADVVFLPYADTVLQAHCQLAACRLNVKCAMLCLVNKDTQYFVAEATKTTVLEDSTQSDELDDGLCYGNINVPKRGGMVEWTLAEEPRGSGDEQLPANFEVMDLQTDPRWFRKKYIQTPPYFRYYCGVPLRTVNGTNIGVLFVMDTCVPEIRHTISARHIKLLASCAKNIMIHLETIKEAHEKERAVNFSMCLADFISPKDRFRRKAHMHSSHIRAPDNLSPTRIVAKSGEVLTLGEEITPSADTPISPHGPANDHATEANESEMESACDPDTERGRSHVARDEEDTPAGKPSLSPPNTERGQSHVARDSQDAPANNPSQSPLKESVTDADHQRTFDRAVALMCHSLDLTLGGGVVLLDTSAAANDKDDNQLPSVQPLKPENRPGQPQRQGDEALPTFSQDEPGASASATPTADAAPRKGTSGLSMEAKVVLAAASIVEPNRAPLVYGRADSTFKVHLCPFELLAMCKNYGRGKLFSLPDSVPTTTYDADGRSVAHAMSAALWYLCLLRRQFPDAKQVIFVPMYHANMNRWTACLAYTTSRYRVLTYDTDYLHTLSFCNYSTEQAIRAEAMRLATEFANQQKSVFIGSVSHELRSPLHGLLAAIEFLQETECSFFQKSCLDTADACAHTLLDTITMVLDYSRLNENDFDPSYSGSTSALAELAADGRKKPPLDKHSTHDPLSATEVVCDLALITEEVVEGVAMGHLMRDRTSIRLDDEQPERDPPPDSRSVHPALARLLSMTLPPEVELVLDIESLSNWEFTTQPGAFRRIVMNLFANALKYTRRGYIAVSLSVVKSPLDLHEEPCTMKLTVRDTGQGISPEFLRTKLFTPFAQENAKAAGSGLGLSIVKALVEMLHGEIDVKSVLNLGTIFIVTLPMKRATAGAPSGESFHRRPKDASVLALQTLPYRPQIAIYQSALEEDSFGQTQGVVAVHKALVQYMTDWYHLPKPHTWSFSAPAELLIMDEAHLPNLLGQRPDFLDSLQNRSLILLCANPRRQADIEKYVKSKKTELLCKPFGPYKLARAISRALERATKSDKWIETVELAKQVNERLDAPLTAVPTQSASAAEVEQRSRSSQPTSSAGADAVTAPPDTVQSRKPRLLIVDDNKINLQLLHNFAKRKGYDADIVKHAEDGLQAVETFKAASDEGVPPEVVFMDISMPVMDGYEATRLIRRDEEDRREGLSPYGGWASTFVRPALMVALTGNTGGKDRSEAFEAGVDVYMTKPMSMKEVGKVLDNWRE
ncbi:hypothetical protein LTR08_004085 [Meristemomyces frigidus]|nr:hypothetical protein LTR08_004085 [Meristemomyces frigidus]